MIKAHLIEVQPRKFLGKTSNFRNKQERAYNQAALQAYLKGKRLFQYGYGFEFETPEAISERRVPSQHLTPIQNRILKPI